MDAVIKHTVSGEVDSVDADKVAFFKRFFAHITRADSWNDIVNETMLVNGKGVAQKIGTIIKTWGEECERSL